MSAKDLEKTWFYIPKKTQNQQLNHLLNNCQQYIIHEVGKLKVFKWKEHCEVINEESLVVKFFDTEEEALNYCLDVYPNTKTTEQLKLL